MNKKEINLLKKRIEKKQIKVGIIGLGYVGLPLALCFAKKGFEVIGVDIAKNRIDKINKGVSYITDIKDKELKFAIKNFKFFVTTDFKYVKKLDAVIICVPTPLRKDRTPDISHIREAVGKIKKNIRKKQIIVLESTTYPGTTKEILKPILESSGLKEGRDFYLAFSPERIDPGNKLYKTENTPKVIGGISQTSTKMATLLYSQVIDSVIPVKSASAAEMVKLLENTFRIVNIALVNEIAILCNKFKLDIWDIINAAKTKPYGFMPFYPGPGVGGHCIPVDPIYLSWKAKEHGFETKFIDLASNVNEEMPQYVVSRIENILLKKKKRMQGAKVMVLGIAYKKNIKDLRESPAISIIDILQKRGVKVHYYDSNFSYFKIDGINLKRSKLDKKTLFAMGLSVIITDHSDVDFEFICKNSKIVLDTRNVYEKKCIKARNVIKL